MSMMIVAKNKELKPWLESFQQYDKNIDIQIYPDIKEKEKITFALVWSKNDVDFTEFKNLRCISSMGAGVEHILKNTSIPKDVYITKIVDKKLVSSMWEYLLCVVLNITTNHYKYIDQQSKSIWKPHSMKPRDEYTLGVLGLGQLGSVIAENFQDMGFTTKGYASSCKTLKGVQTYTNLEEFCKDVDIVINLLPLTPDTKGILNKELFSKINSKGYIINTGRGRHLIEEDLLEALDAGHLSGAILDVFKKEPLPSESLLWQHPQVVITPHSASITDPHSVSEQVMQNYQRVSDRKKPNNTINKKRAY